MMRNLPIPATDDKISLDTIISEKRGINKTNLTAISQNVKNAYDMHLANSTAQENLVPIVLSSDQKVS
ncbi:hypothetical protein, partial [Serratia marcescens]